MGNREAFEKACEAAGTADKAELFLRVSLELGGYRSADRTLYRCYQTFSGISIPGKSLLEIGAGTGVFSAFAAVTGAKHVTALEPEAAGSTAGYTTKIRRCRQWMNLPNFEVCGSTIQEYRSNARLYDVVLLYNSINHLDEPCCMALLDDPHAYHAYQGIFRKIVSMMRPGAVLVLADCSRYNAFAMLGLRPPLAPYIEWHKHHTPATWIELLTPLGLGQPSVDWTRYHPLRHMRGLAANAVFNFFTSSHFRLVMRYQAPLGREES